MSISQHMKLREVIYMYSEAAKKSDAEFLRLWRIAFRGLVQMGMNSFWLPKTVTLPVNDNNTVGFPADYLMWIKVGFDDGVNLTTLNSNDGLYNNDHYGNAAQYARSDDWFNGDTRLGKSSHRSKVGFRVEGNYLALDQNFTGTTILFEYLAAPEKDVDYQIPIQYTEAMISWLSWQDMIHMPATSHFNRGDKLDRAASFRAELKLAKKMYKPFRISEAI